MLAGFEVLTSKSICNAELGLTAVSTVRILALPWFSPLLSRSEAHTVPISQVAGVAPALLQPVTDPANTTTAALKLALRFMALPDGGSVRLDPLAGRRH